MLESKPRKLDTDVVRVNVVHLDAVVCKTSSLGESLDGVFLRRDLSAFDCQSQSSHRFVVVDLGLLGIGCDRNRGIWERRFLGGNGESPNGHCFCLDVLIQMTLDRWS